MNYIERMILAAAQAERCAKLREEQERKAKLFRGVPVIAYKDGIEVGRYASSAKAAKALGLIPRLVAYVAEGKRKHTRGYKFAKVKI